MKSMVFKCAFLHAMAFVAIIVSAPVLAEPIETLAKQALIVDYSTGAVILGKNADDLMAPSSMSKLMTVYMVFRKLREGTWKLSDELPVTKSAWEKHYRSGGSLMFLPLGSSAKVEDLLRGVIIQSGNDACSVLAEAYSGSEDTFAEEETRYSRQVLGMNHSTFKNASGWPDPDHLTTARDLALLAHHIISDFPEYYSIFSEKSFTYNRIKQDNRNPLLWGEGHEAAVEGADGLKTGHTESGGYGLTGSVKRGDRRIIMVVNGIERFNDRWGESKRLVEWAFREFNNYTLYKAGDQVVAADVWLGELTSIPLVTGNTIEVTMPRKSRHDMKVIAMYNGPIAAPISKGAVLGKLVVSAPGMDTSEFSLLAGADVPQLGLTGRITAAIRYLVWGPKG